MNPDRQNNAKTDAPGNKEKLPWQFRTSTIVMALCCIGPLALPLLWFKPATSLAKKMLITLAVLLLSAGLCWATWKSINVIIEAYRLLQSI